MTVRVTIWEPGKHGRNGVLVALAVVLAPVLIVVGLITLLVTWSARKLFPPKPLSAVEMIKELDAMLGGETDYEIDYGLQVITRCDFDDKRLADFKRRVVAIGSPPWTDAAIDELKAIRDSARAIAAGDAA